MKPTVSEYFDAFYKKVGVSQKDFCKNVGVSESTIKNMKNRQTEPSLATLSKIQKVYPTFDLLNRDIVNIQKIHNPPYREAISEDEINIHDIDAAANLKTILDDKKQNVIGSMRVPNLPKCDAAIYIRGDSMYPLLKSGDLVAFKFIPKESIILGEMYLVDYSLNGDDFLVVKYVKSSDIENHVSLVSYNVHHDPMDIHLDNIRSIAIIKASVRFNTMI